MKLTVTKRPELEDDFVDIQYHKLSPKITQVLQICEGESSVLLCEKDKSNH